MIMTTEDTLIKILLLVYYYINAENIPVFKVEQDIYSNWFPKQSIGEFLINKYSYKGMCIKAKLKVFLFYSIK